MCLQHDLREAGIDPDKLPRFSDRAMTRNYHALQAGDIEVMQAFEPFVSMAERDGAGEVLYAASARGPTAYTAFIATRDACEKYRDEFAAMTRATAKMLAWVYASPAEELAAGVATFFPDVPKDILARSLGRYRDAGLWSRETRMIPQGFARLAQSLFRADSLARMPRYDECVEPILNEIRPESIKLDNQHDRHDHQGRPHHHAARAVAGRRRGSRAMRSATRATSWCSRSRPRAASSAWAICSRSGRG